MSEEKFQFVGSNKVAMVADTTFKTPMGSDIVEVTYEDGSKEQMPKKTFELVVTDVPSDASIRLQTKLNALIPAIKLVICEYDIQASEIQSMLNQLSGSIDNNFSRAVNFMMSKDDRQYVPNSNPVFRRTLLEMDRIIKSIPEVTEAKQDGANTNTTANAAGADAGADKGASAGSESAK